MAKKTVVVTTDFRKVTLSQFEQDLSEAQETYMAFASARANLVQGAEQQIKALSKTIREANAIGTKGRRTK